MAPKHRIRQYLLENFLFSGDHDALPDDAPLLGSGILDSTGVHELVMFLEETWNVAVAPDEMVPANFHNVDAVDAFLARKLAA